jgi:hypothetical protein
MDRWMRKCNTVSYSGKATLPTNMLSHRTFGFFCRVQYRGW